MAMLCVNENYNYTSNAWLVLANKHPYIQRKCFTVIRLLLNIYRLGKTGCYACENQPLNSVSHILFNCNVTKEIRYKKWKLCEQSYVGNIVTEINSMHFNDKTRFILNMCCIPYVAEWEDLYLTLLDYIVSVTLSYFRLKC